MSSLAHETCSLNTTTTTDVLILISNIFASLFVLPTHLRSPLFAILLWQHSFIKDLRWLALLRKRRSPGGCRRRNALFRLTTAHKTPQRLSQLQEDLARLSCRTGDATKSAQYAWKAGGEAMLVGADRVGYSEQKLKACAKAKHIYSRR
ncbi:hypothetical protein BU26DRAFT_68617 [Trematosphaeria pertusa]|uniref:Uncharacterized protein n=1 Tax=Trematosphaeria pertusa TaxID=390896 RepID=A0A6A6I520_9PLEO|nr:uncharacterized protein BU26DRAFT_68617 [Trematosphaeria pertusa]KAF2245451.1 hypothetical protein BU26DRAFT_68617 [Trematosphaeria pertusa]